MSDIVHCNSDFRKSAITFLIFLFSVGVFKNGRVEIIANDQGNRITPSYVAFTAEGERLIGDAAKNQLTTNPENTVFDAKRMIGREWTDSAVQHDLKYFPFKVVEKNTKPHITLTTSTGDQSFAAEEISAMVLVKMKETAEAYLGKKVTHAVVTVPAVSCNFDYPLRFCSMRLFCDLYYLHKDFFILSNYFVLRSHLKTPKISIPQNQIAQNAHVTRFSRYCSNYLIITTLFLSSLSMFYLQDDVD